MTPAGITKAKAEAIRFLAAVNELEEYDPTASKRSYFWASKHTAAVKRASMDLTRALAEMRKPG